VHSDVTEVHDPLAGRDVGRRMVVARSNCSRIAVKSKSNFSCNHRLREPIHSLFLPSRLDVLYCGFLILSYLTFGGGFLGLSSCSALA